MVATVVPVDLPLHFPGLLVEGAVGVRKNALADLSVKEIFTNSGFVELGLLVEQGILEVVSLAQVLPGSIFVVLVVLVCQSLLVVVLVRQVNLGFATVENAFRNLVVRALLVCESCLQVLRLAEVFQDGQLVQLAVLVKERLFVDFGILEFLGSDGLGADHRSLVRRQVSELRIRFSGLAGLGLGLESRSDGGGGRLGGHGGLRSLGGYGRLGRWSLRGQKSRSRLTSLELIEIFSNFKVQALNVTSVKRRVGHLEELTSLEVVVVIEFTGLDFVTGLSGHRDSKCGSTEDSDSKVSDFGRHDVWIIRSFLRTCVKLENKVK
jgi:hypothetical protein